MRDTDRSPLDGMLTQAGDVFARLHNQADGSAMTLSIPAGAEHSPYWVHIRNWKPVALKADPGQSTEWTEVGSLLDFLAPELAASRVVVERAFAPGLPAIRGDEARLRGAFLNLLRNAREAMPGGGRITIRTRPFEGGAEAQLQDTGGGIPAGDLTRIFEPFYSTKERGTGLGLAFALQVVQGHGGAIRCESAVGRGTCYTVSLPAAAGARAPAPAEVASA